MSDPVYAVLGGGCFWCLDAVLRDMKGVKSVIPGYAGGHTTNPTYEQVCTDTTGHAEVVKVIFDPGIMSYDDLLRIFFTLHNPTTLNRQGDDIGTQYRSCIFYTNDAQQQSALTIKKEIEEADIWGNPLVTEIAPLSTFWPAEEKHLNYYNNNPQTGYCAAVIAPKVVKMRKLFAERYR